jgi:hypothetical protein
MTPTNDSAAGEARFVFGLPASRLRLAEPGSY